MVLSAVHPCDIARPVALFAENMICEAWLRENYCRRQSCEKTKKQGKVHWEWRNQVEEYLGVYCEFSWKKEKNATSPCHLGRCTAKKPLSIRKFVTTYKQTAACTALVGKIFETYGNTSFRRYFPHNEKHTLDIGEGTLQTEIKLRGPLKLKKAKKRTIWLNPHLPEPLALNFP